MTKYQECYYAIQDIWGQWALCPSIMYNKLVDILYITPGYFPYYENHVIYVGIPITLGYIAVYDSRCFAKHIVDTGTRVVTSMTIFTPEMRLSPDVVVMPLERDYNMLIERKRNIIERGNATSSSKNMQQPAPVQSSPCCTTSDCGGVSVSTVADEIAPASIGSDGAIGKNVVPAPTTSIESSRGVIGYTGYLSKRRCSKKLRTKSSVKTKPVETNSKDKSTSTFDEIEKVKVKIADKDTSTDTPKKAQTECSNSAKPELTLSPNLSTVTAEEIETLEVTISEPNYDEALTEDNSTKRVEISNVKVVSDEGEWTIYYSKKYKKQAKLWRRLNSGVYRKIYVEPILPRPLQVEPDGECVTGRKFFKWREYNQEQMFINE